MTGMKTNCIVAVHASLDTSRSCRVRIRTKSATALIAFTLAGNRPRLHSRAGRGLRANKFFLLPCGGLCVFAPQR